MLSRYAAVADEAVPAAGLTLQRALVTTAAPALDAAGWDATVAALMGVARDDPLSRLAAGVQKNKAIYHLRQPFLRIHHPNFGTCT